MRRPVLWGTLVAVLLVVGFVVFMGTRETTEGVKTPSRLLGQAAPAISSTTADGAPFKLSSLRGHWVVINFFASWCPPCKQEAPELVAFDWAQQKQAGGAKLVSVVFNDSNASARQFHEYYGARWPLVLDPGGNTAARYGVLSPPETFVVNPRGVVVAALAGATTEAQLSATLARAKATEGG